MTVTLQTSPAIKATRHQRSHGRGGLTVKHALESTCIDRLYQEGCAKIRLPATDGDGMQAVMINASGGITGGDRLHWDFTLRDLTRLTVTSQACERIYAASEDVGRVDISLTIGRGARLAWVPQETILFNNGALRRTINVEMEPDAELLMVEPLVFGRKAMSETVRSGTIRDSWRIRRCGQLLHAEETRFERDIATQLASRAVAGGKVAMASLLLIGDHAESVLNPARKIIGPSGGVSFWNGKLLARIVAEDSYQLRKTLMPLIRLLNRNASLPKVWAL